MVRLRIGSVSPLLTDAKCEVEQEEDAPYHGAESDNRGLKLALLT